VTVVGEHYLAAQLFVGAMLFYINAFMVAYLWPYTDQLLNWASIFSGCAKAIYILILLASIDNVPNSRSYFGAVLGLYLISLIAMVVLLLTRIKKRGLTQPENYRIELTNLMDCCRYTKKTTVEQRMLLDPNAAVEVQ